VPFDIRPEHPLTPTEPACSSNSREEIAATPASLVLRGAQASAIPGSGSWQLLEALPIVETIHAAEEKTARGAATAE
jgi:hypothetical protein